MSGQAIMTLAHLNEQQQAYVAAIVAGASRELAEKEAGYQPTMGYSLDRNPRVVAAIHQEVARRLRVEGAPLGLSVLLSIAKDTKAPSGVRVDAAKTLLSRAGHIEPRAEAAKPDRKDMSDMSQAELRAVIDQCESQLAERATTINAPNAGPSTAQHTDMFE